MTEKQRVKAQAELEKRGGAASASAPGEPAAAAPAVTAPEPEAERDLDDPATQFRILNPEELRYDLDLPGVGRREIIVRTEFTLRDVHTVRILDDLEAFRMRVPYEVSSVDGEQFRRFEPGSVLSMKRFELAMTRSSVRDEARAILTKLARFAEPLAPPAGAPAGTPARVQPTLEEITIGMAPEHMLATCMYLLNRYDTEVERRKNAQRTTPAA